MRVPRILRSVIAAGRVVGLVPRPPGRPPPGHLSPSAQDCLLFLRAEEGRGGRVETVTEVAARVGLHRPAASRALRLLRARGYVAPRGLALLPRAAPVTVCPPPPSPSPSPVPIPSETDPPQAVPEPDRPQDSPKDGRSERARLAAALAGREAEVAAGSPVLAADLARWTDTGPERAAAFLTQARRARRPVAWLVAVLAGAMWGPADWALEESAAARRADFAPPAAVTAGIDLRGLVRHAGGGEEPMGRTWRDYYGADGQAGTQATGRTMPKPQVRAALAGIAAGMNAPAEGHKAPRLPAILDPRELIRLPTDAEKADFWREQREKVAAVRALAGQG